MDEKSTILLARSSFFPFFFYLIHDLIIGCVIDPFRARKLVIIRANKAHDIDPRARDTREFFGNAFTALPATDWFLDILQYNRFLDYLESDPFFPPLYRSRAGHRQPTDEIIIINNTIAISNRFSD